MRAFLTALAFLGFIFAAPVKVMAGDADWFGGYDTEYATGDLFAPADFGGYEDYKFAVPDAEAYGDGDTYDPDR
jgi:hypothetical protein